MDDKARKPSSLGTIGFMIAAIIFAAIAGILLSQVMESTYSQEPVKAVVVAAVAIPAGEPMRKEDLKVASWPESSIPAGAYQKVEDPLKKKRVPLVPFVPGEAILSTHLSKPNAGMGVATLITQDRRALALRTDSPVTLARLLYPGAKVDVLCTMRDSAPDPESNRPKVSTKIVLQNVKVLAVGEDIDPLTISHRRRRRDKEKQEGALSGGEENREKLAVVTLLVTPEEAERVILARREGDIDIILRSPKDNKQVDTPGATPLAFLPMDEENALLLEGLSGTEAAAAAATKSTARRGSSRRSRRTKPATTDGKFGRKKGPGVVIIR